MDFGRYGLRAILDSRPHRLYDRLYGTVTGFPKLVYINTNN